MTPDERTLLTSFLQDLGSSRTQTKDNEADAMIGSTLAANPDAAYLLVQHTIVADQSLHAAQAQIAELETQLKTAQSSATPQAAQQPTSFLSGAGPWGQPAQAARGLADERPSVFSSGGGLSSFLRSAGTTAAGVAGGEMLFSGLSGLFGGHQGGFGSAGLLGQHGGTDAEDSAGDDSDDSDGSSDAIDDNDNS